MSITVSSITYPLTTIVPSGSSWFSYSLLVYGDYSEEDPYPFPDPPPVPVDPEPDPDVPDPLILIEGTTTLSDSLIRRWITSSSYTLRSAWDTSLILRNNFNPRTFEYETDSYLLQTNIAVNPNYSDYLTVTIGSTVIQVRRATSKHDFFSTSQPVWITIAEFKEPPEVIESQVSQVILRNVENITKTTYLYSGSLTIDDELEDIHEDTPLWYINKIALQDIIPDNFKISMIPAKAMVWDTTVTATLLTSGTVTYTYRCLSRLETIISSGTATLGLETSPISLLPIENMLDSIARPLGLERIYLESNRSFADRIYKATRIPRGSNQDALPFVIGLDLGLVELLYWDGSTTLDLVASGYTDIIDVGISETPQIEYQGVEQLSYSGTSGMYTSIKKEWEPGYGLYLNGETVTTENYPSLTVTSTGITIGSDVSGTLLAEYSARNYNTTTSGSYITSIVPVSGNIEIKDRVVTLVRDLTTWNPTTEDNIQNKLTSSDGKPNEVLLRLVNHMKESLPILIGSSNWGTNERWFSDTEDKPAIGNIPIVFY